MHYCASIPSVLISNYFAIGDQSPAFNAHHHTRDEVVVVLELVLNLAADGESFPHTPSTISRFNFQHTKIKHTQFPQWFIPDYRHEHGRVPVFASCVIFSTPDSLSSSKREVNPVIGDWTSTYLIEVLGWMSESHWWLLFHEKLSEKLRLKNLVYNLTNSNLGLNAGSSNASPARKVHFLGGDKGLLKEGVKTTVIKWHQCSPLTNQHVFCLHVYSLYYTVVHSHLQVETRELWISILWPENQQIAAPYMPKSNQ